ncbi:MAG: tetratricopeptide repeat protein [Fibrobacterota bacterium]
MNLNKDELRNLEERVKKVPGSPGFARLADHYRIAGHVDNAIALCETGVKANPEYPTGHLLLGRCYFEKERVEDARKEFETVLRLDRKNIFALKIIGDMEAQKGDKSAAARFYKMAADFDPLNSETQSMFRQFAQFYKPGSAALPIGPAPAQAETPLPAAEAPPAEALAETLMEPAIAAPAETEMLDLSGAQNFDDLEKAVDNAAASDAGAAPTEPELSPNPPVTPEPEAAAVEPLRFEAETPASEIEFPEIQVDAAADNLASIPEPGETVPRPQAEASHPPETVDPGIETEMVDLPPEMTGAIEARVGDFRIRKSLFDRLLDEQHGLFEEVAERGTLPLPDETSAEGPVPDAAHEAQQPPQPQSEISASAAGMDGFFNVEGDASDSNSDAAMAGIDNVEIDGIVDDMAVETENEAPQKTAPAPVDTASPESGSAFAEDLLADMDVDDDLKTFAVEAAALQATSLQPEPLAAPAQPEIKTAPVQPEISSSAAGMDGFFNIEGASSDSENNVALAGIDDVEIDGRVDDATLEEPDAGPAQKDGAIELGTDVEFEIPTVAAAAPRPQAAPETKMASETQTQKQINEIFENAAPKTGVPVKSGAPVKKPKTAKAAPRVVSNVATSSLADIYLRQGHKEQALAVYRKMLEQKPDNKRILAKIEKLEEEIENEE